MRLRALALRDVRRFVAPVQIAGLDRGLNVLAAPNESGKSTLFEALHALLTVKHSAKGENVRSLAPHGGGAPTVAADVETADGVFTLRKRWLSRSRAQVLQGDRVIAQADEAEAWIADLVQSGAEGPAGLLWVRQGQVDLSEAMRWSEGRRDLLSAMEAQVDAAAGGQRLDRVIAACGEALGVYRTARAGRAAGPLKATEAALAAAQQERDGLAARAEALRAALAERRAARRDLAALSSPEHAAERNAEIARARAALAEATTRDARRARAQADVALAEANLRSATEAGEAIRRAKAERVEADAEIAEAEAAQATADAERLGAQERLTRAEADHATAQTHVTMAMETFVAAQHAALTEQIAKAEDATATLAQARAAIAAGPTPDALARLRGLHQAVSIAQAREAAAASRYVISYGPGQDGRILLDGRPLAGGTAHTIVEETRLSLGDLGHLTILPGTVDTGPTSAEASTALAEALAEAGFPDLPTAEAGAQTATEARTDAKAAQDILQALAPEGLPAVRSELENLPPKPDRAPDAPTPDPATAERHLEEARSRSREAKTRMETATAATQASTQSHIRAGERLERALERKARIASTAPDLSDEAEAEAGETRKAAEQAFAEAQAARGALEASPHDLTTAQSRLDAAEAAVTDASNRQARLAQDIARLDGQIATAAGDGIEAALDEAEAHCATLETRLAEITFERDMLLHLTETLEQARQNARARYFTPVMTELRPMLASLWPEADILWNEHTLLPEALLRRGQQEALTALSGGTIEQLALLVRLAYGRVLAHQGRPAPVILDDALIFSDDRRLEALFDTLRAQAEAMQVIVLTCHARSFAALGGHRIDIEPAAPQTLDLA